MKPSLIGLPSQPRIAIFKHEIVSVLRANPGFHNVSDISHVVIGHKLNHLVEFAKAIGELENEGTIKPATNGTKLFYQLASNGEKGNACGVIKVPERECALTSGRCEDASPAGNLRIYPAQERPSLLRKANEIEFCSAGCGRVASGECDCGVQICSVCRFLPDGERSMFGSCKECSKVPQDSTEVFNSYTGRAQ